MQVTALSSWYGSNRMLAKNVGLLLKGCDWVGVPFAGGMSELANLDARTMLVSDLHRHVINLARVVADKDAKDEMVRRLDELPFHPDVLANAQEKCRERERRQDWSGDTTTWACCFFVCCWMARNGTAGTDREFDAGLSVRWEAQGGDSATRFRSATQSLNDWHHILRRCTFVCLDVFDFLDAALRRDAPRFKNGLYLDAPWPNDGEKYKHKFGEEQQLRLARELAAFEHVRVVVRFADHPLIRELYPKEAGWRWLNLTGRTAANKPKREVLLCNRVTPVPEALTPLLEDEASAPPSPP